MNSVDFCFWLQGYFEISNSGVVSPSQVECIKNHLNLVFKHEIDRIRDAESLSNPAALNAAHIGNSAAQNDELVRC
jgi:hypothetical protein